MIWLHCEIVCNVQRWQKSSLKTNPANRTVGTNNHSLSVTRPVLLTSSFGTNQRSYTNSTNRLQLTQNAAALAGHWNPSARPHHTGIETDSWQQIEFKVAVLDAGISEQLTTSPFYTFRQRKCFFLVVIIWEGRMSQRKPGRVPTWCYLHLINFTAL